MNTGIGTLRIARIGGLDVKIHWSLLIIVLLISVEMATGYFPTHVPGASSGTYWVLGLITAVLLFGSVLLHELSHSLVARAKGLPVRDITLFLFGGVSNIEQEPERAGDEFVIAVVGPLTSFVLAALFWGLAQVVVPVGVVSTSAVAVLHDLAFINLMLGAFNLVPGFPLDGGRVLRAAIWAGTRNYTTATRAAGFVGQLIAYGFIVWGVYQTFFAGNFSGLWTALIGWFLLSNAAASVAAVNQQATLRGLTVGQAMAPAPATIQPQMTLSYMLNRYVLPYNLRAVPVAENGRFLGFAALSDMKDVPQEQWGAVRVSQIMPRTDDDPNAGSATTRTVQASDPLQQAVQRLDEGDLEQVGVVDPAGSLVGVLDREGLRRWLQIRQTPALNGTAPA